MLGTGLQESMMGAKQGLSQRDLGSDKIKRKRNRIGALVSHKELLGVVVHKSATFS